MAELRHGLLQELRGRLKLVEVLSSNLEDRLERSENVVRDGVLLTGGGDETWKIRMQGSQYTEGLHKNVRIKALQHRLQIHRAYIAARHLEPLAGT